MEHSTVQSREILPFAAAALIGLASVLLPGPETDWLVFAIGAGLTVAIAAIGLLAAEKRRGPAADPAAAARVLRRGRDPAALGNHGRDRVRAADHAADRLARHVRHPAPADRRARGHDPRAGRSVPRVRRPALSGHVLAQRAALPRRRGADRARHPVAGGARAAEQRDARRRAPQRHRDGDRGHRRERHDHRLQPRSRAHARLRRRRGRRQGVGGDAARSRGGRGARRRARRRGRARGVRLPGARAAAVDVRAQGRPADPGRHCRSPPSATTTARSRASSAWRPTSPSACARRPPSRPSATSRRP